MQTGSRLRPGSLILLLAAAACADAQPPASAPADQQAASATVRGSTILVDSGGRRMSATVDLHGAPIARGGEAEIEILRTTAAYVVMIDDRPSEPQSLSRCQAGRERFLRVLSFALQRETFSRLIESCRTGVVAGDPAIEWTPGGFRLTIVEGGASGVFAIAADGRVVTTGERPS